MANSFVQAAKKVLQTEADALETLKNDLPNDFSDLVKLILNLNGRVILELANLAILEIKLLQHWQALEHPHTLFMPLRPVMVTWV